jgi:hypothetical protein
MRRSTNDEHSSSDEVPFPIAFRPHPHALSMIYTPDVPSKLACIFNEPDALHLLLDCVTSQSFIAVTSDDVCSEAEMLLWLVLRPIIIIIMYLKNCLVILWIDDDCLYICMLPDDGPLRSETYRSWCVVML